MSHYPLSIATTGPGDLSVRDTRSASRLLSVLCFFTVLVVLAAHSNQPELVRPSLNLRFVMYATLIVVGMAFPHGLRWSPSLGFTLVAFSILSLSSTTWTVTGTLTLQRATGFVLLIGAALLTLSRVRVGFEHTRRCFIALSSGVVVFMAVGLILFALGSVETYQVSSPEQGPRFTGLLGNPNSVGVAVGLFLPVLLGLRAGCSSSLARMTYNVSIAIFLLSLLLSQSRGGAVAAAVGFAAYALYDRKLDRNKALLGAIGVLITGLSLLVVVPRQPPAMITELRERFTGSQPESAGGSGRIVAWSLALDVWKERPFSGWGFGATETVFGPRAVEIEDVFEGHNPHNSYLNSLIDLGPQGMALLIIAVCAALNRSLRRRHEPFVAGLAGAVCAGVVISMFESGLTAAGSLLGFVFWFAAIGLARLTEGLS